MSNLCLILGWKLKSLPLAYHGEVGEKYVMIAEMTMSLFRNDQYWSVLVRRPEKIVVNIINMLHGLQIIVE